MSTTSLPPRPRGSALGHTARFLRDPFALIADATAEHGDLFTVRLLGLGTWVFAGAPALLKELFKAPPGTLAAGEVNRRQLGFMLGTDATFSLGGDAHRQRQKIVQPLLNGRRTHCHIASIRAITERRLAAWPTATPFAFLEHGHRISLDVLMGALFHGTEAARLQALTDRFDTFARRGLRSPLMILPFLQRDLGPWSPWGRILRLRRAVVEAFGAEIAARLEACSARSDGDGEPDGEETDVLLAMIRATQRDGRRLDHGQLLDESINLAFAGHETTGTILTWTLAAVLSRPEVLAQLRAELDDTLGGAPIMADHLDRLPYLDAVINEAIRFHPIAPMAGVRLVKAPFEIGGYRLPPGTIVTQCFPAMCRRRDLFAHPERFDPGHFYQRKLLPFEWHPFGGGTRMCIGRGLAELELKVVLVTLLQRAELRLAQESLRPVRQGFFFSPEKGLQVVLERRLSPAG